MTNYSNGKIYKIEPINGEDGDVYIGSTTKKYLSQRMTAHRTDYKRFLNEKGANVRSFKLFEKYGIENCKIILLELVNANTKDELLAREAHYIKSVACVNKMVPLQTSKEYREANRDLINEKNIQAYTANKDAINERRRQAYQITSNKDKKKEYAIANKEKIKERKRLAYQNKKQQQLTL